MNSKVDFAWDDAKQIADRIVFNKFQEYLKDIEILVLKGSWEGLTYEKMAELYHHTVNYLRGDVGPRLWHKLSVASGEVVTKSNFKAALERAWEKSVPAPLMLMEFPFPEGSVPLDSPFYMERHGVESLCYETIIKSGSLIRIKAPALMGKTSLITRILAHAESHHFHSVYLDFSSVEQAKLRNLDELLRWLCLMVSRQLKVENQIKHYWDTEILGSNDNCTVYFEEYLLTTIEGSIILGLDAVDRLFSYTEVIEDFLGMLRSWHEKGRISPRWKQFSLVMAHSTEVYIPLDINQSPFNAGVPVELMEFEKKQVEKLVHLHHLDWSDRQIEDLMSLVGGHPYLVRLALYEVSSLRVKLDQLLQEAPTESGIYSNHLRRHLETLQKASPEAQALKKVVSSPQPVELDSRQIYKLHSMGLVKRQDNHVIPRCNLYREYFSRVL